LYSAITLTAGFEPAQHSLFGSDLTSLNRGGIGRGALIDAAVHGIVDSLLQLRQGAVGLRAAIVVELGPHRVGDPGAQRRRLAERLHVGQAAGGLEDAGDITA
jgi:hypothetical protein